LLLGGCAAAPPKSPDGTRTAAQSRSLSPAEIAEAALPAVVLIRTPAGFGSGFVVRSDGWVVTNLHVIAGADEAVVTFADQRSLPVREVVNASARHDLALLHVDAKGLPVLKLGKSEDVRAGDAVVAIGHPLGLEDTVSNGLVSAIRRKEDLTALQISAPIAPGSSGGPLFNDHGEVIGVAMGILRGGQNINIGVPVEYVHQLMREPSPVALAAFAAASAPAEAEAEPERKRDIPRHELSIWAGCDEGALKLVGHGISEAVEVGAPLYNQGNPAACYHVYSGAAADLERRLPKQCRGPRLALERGRNKAEKLQDPVDQAWTMRDAFDGLTDVLLRRLRQNVGK
jgi:serine protease Do